MSLLGRVLLIVVVALLPALAAQIYNQRALRAVQQGELESDSLLLRQAEQSLAASGQAGVERLPNLAELVRLHRSATAAQAAQEAAAWRSYAMFAAGLAGAFGCALLLAWRMIAAPAEHILRTIARWRAGDALARVGAAGGRSELGRIGAALDELLAAFERTETALRADQSALAARVAERTRQLDAEVREREQAQALLQQAQKMEVVGQLTGGVAHDFNNLLTAIIGNLELAGLRSRDRPEIQRLLTAAMRGAERGAALTQRMLAFGRQQYLRLEPIEIPTLLDGMGALLARSVGPTVTLRVAVPQGLWQARADTNQLELVLLNLAINARDAMPQGGVLAITAGNEQVLDDAAHPARLSRGDYVRINLTDHGVGIGPETLGRVLEPFFTTKPAGKASGLGLSMAQGVAAQSGGGLAIESQLGQGTTVSVWLPRAVPEIVPQSVMQPHPAAADGCAPVQPSILLVDDDAEVAEVTQQCLEDAGFVVQRRADGETALALLECHTPIDLLIADLAMPGMNGIQLAERAQLSRPGLPVLLATGYADVAVRQGGTHEYPVLAKPFRAAQLLDAVGRLLAQSGPVRSIRPGGNEPAASEPVTSVSARP